MGLATFLYRCVPQFEVLTGVHIYNYTPPQLQMWTLHTYHCIVLYITINVSKKKSVANMRHTTEAATAHETTRCRTARRIKKLFPLLCTKIRPRRQVSKVGLHMYHYQSDSNRGSIQITILFHSIASTCE